MKPEGDQAVATVRRRTRWRKTVGNVLRVDGQGAVLPHYAWVNAAPVPEPASVLLMDVRLGGVGVAFAAAGGGVWSWGWAAARDRLPGLVGAAEVVAGRKKERSGFKT